MKSEPHKPGLLYRYHDSIHGQKFTSLLLVPVKIPPLDMPCLFRQKTEDILAKLCPGRLCVFIKFYNLGVVIAILVTNRCGRDISYSRMFAFIE